MYKAQKNLPFKEIVVKLFPEIVQLQTISYCNGRCVMCPYPDTHRSVIHGTMPLALYKKIIDECCSFGIKEFKPFLMNEPLLDGRLPDMISYARKKLPNTKIGFSTNGLLMEREMIPRIVDSGVDEVWFNFSGNTEDTYKKVMKGLNFKRVRKNIIDFAYYVQHNQSIISVNISMVEVKECLEEIEDSVTFWKEYGVVVHPIPYNNRGGNSKEEGIKVLKCPIGKRVCDKSIIKACVLFDGRMILCPSDWKQNYVIGDVSHNSLYDIWNGKKRQEYVDKILKCDYDSINICKYCDYTMLFGDEN